MVLICVSRPWITLNKRLDVYLQDENEPKGQEEDSNTLQKTNKQINKRWKLILNLITITKSTELPGVMPVKVGVCYLDFLPQYPTPRPKK